MTETQVRVPWPGWEISEHLGGGSFGAVYKIQRNISGVTEYAAMKTISVPKEPGETRELLESGYDLYSINQRFRSDLEEIQKEYSMMALLKGNANVVYCDDICDEPNPDGVGWTLYIRMELLTPLTKALEDPCSEAQVVKVGMDLCNALAACKRKNIIHRDIKPANIMVAEDGNYKLGDFGVAKTMEGTSGGTKTGTYNFMAPEVYNNRPYGHSADIYSLGMVLYWMLNRRTVPFLPLLPEIPTASQREDAKERRFSGEPLPAPVDGSQALQRIVMRACAFDPAQRYSNPEELYAALASVPAAKQETARDDASFGAEMAWDDMSSKTDPNAKNAREKKFDQNSWESEYDKTDGSVSNVSKMGPMDVKATVSVTAQELASGCVKRVAINSVFGNVVIETAMKAQVGSAASAYAKTAAKMVDITIPAGTKAGTVLHLTGAGRVDTATGARGDAYVTVVLSNTSQQGFWEEQSIDAEVVVPAHLAKNGCGQAVMVKGKKYLTWIPAGVSNGQVIQVEATSPGEGKRKLTVRIRILEDPAEPAKEKKPIRWGLILWILFGIVMLFALPPAGIGCLALSLPFLFIKNK